jgi:hypothetical protein
MKLNRKDFVSGVFLVAVGLFYLLYAVATLTIGRALSMGPGYFPVLLSSLTILIGLVITGRSLVAGRTGRVSIAPARAIIFVSLSVIAFAALLERLGLFPVVLLCVSLACLADPEARWSTIAGTSAAISALCTIVFRLGLKLPVPAFGPWLGG